MQGLQYIKETSFIAELDSSIQQADIGRLVAHRDASQEMYVKESYYIGSLDTASYQQFSQKL